MAKFSNATTFSRHFKIDPIELKKVGLLDPILNLDTRLFIDPLLLEFSSNPIIKEEAATEFKEYFKAIIKLLKVSKQKNDLPWMVAGRRFTFPEIKGTCLGYGANNISGSGMGSEIKDALLSTAKQIIDLGVDDPELFCLLPLISDKIGADRISDMTTNIIVPQLIKITEKFCKELSLECTWHYIKGERHQLPKNPFEGGPILLVPKDILRNLPVATDWSEISTVTSQNEQLRQKINRLIGDLWSKDTRSEKKAKIREAVLSDKESAQDFVDFIKSLLPVSYNFDQDPEGFIRWINYLGNVGFEPLSETLNFQKIESVHDAKAVVDEILRQFQELVENKGLNKELWVSPLEHRGEFTAQRIFYAVADTFCKVYDIDVTPSADAGRGPVDFKFSKGKSIKVLVEVKLSDNPKLVHGYETQLEEYKKAENADEAILLIVDVGGMGKKLERIYEHRNKLLQEKIKPSDIYIVDGNLKKSASKF